MAIARVVSFDGVSKERMAEMEREMREGEQPDDIPATEIIVLHDADAEKSLVLVFFENDEDYRRGDAALDAMPADETPGRRSDVARYDVAFRTTR